jgi:anti-sigma B factor antagonist
MPCAPAAGLGWFFERPIAAPEDEEHRVDLSIASESHGEVTVVHVGGEIDVYTAPMLREHLDEHISRGRHHLVVDLEDVPFMDSTGLGVLVGRLKLVRVKDGTLCLVCSSERILKVFSITGLDKVFQIFPSLDDALAATA